MEKEGKESERDRIRMASPVAEERWVLAAEGWVLVTAALDKRWQPMEKSPLQTASPP